MATCTLNLNFQTTAKYDFEQLLYWKKGHEEAVLTVFVLAPAIAKLQYILFASVHGWVEARPWAGLTPTLLPAWSCYVLIPSRQTHPLA